MNFSMDTLDIIPHEIGVGDPLWPFKHTVDQLRLLEEPGRNLHKKVMLLLILRVI